MNTVAKLREFVKQDLWTTDLDAVNPIRRIGIQSLRLGIAVAWEFRHRLLDARAAGLVFTTLLSLVPFLAVMFSALKGFGVHHQIEPMLAQALAPLGPKGEEITANLIGFVDNLKVRVLGVVGVAGLFYTTYSLINKVEEALNAIWQVRHGRSWGRKFTDYLSVVLVGPVLVVTALGLLTSVQSQALVQRLLEIQPFGHLLVWVANLGPFFLLCGLFTFFYKFIPHTWVQTSSALVGGIVAAVLWGIAGEVFAKFVAQSANYSAIYSSFAVLIVFLLWLYVGWLIVLIGAQFSYFHQHPAAYLSHLPWQQEAYAFRERLALSVLVAVARHYFKGDRPPREPELATELHLPLSLIEDQVQQLVDQGFIGRLAEPDGVSLLKPPELVSVKEILDATRGGGRDAVQLPNAHDRVDEVLRRRDEAVKQSLAGLTLRSLALGPGESPTAESQAA